jgi:hypothetical protein
MVDIFLPTHGINGSNSMIYGALIHHYGSASRRTVDFESFFECGATERGAPFRINPF